MVRGTERALRDTSRCSEGAVARAARPQRRYGETIPMRLSPDLKGEVDAWARYRPLNAVTSDLVAGYRVQTLCGPFLFRFLCRVVNITHNHSLQRPLGGVYPRNIP